MQTDAYAHLPIISAMAAETDVSCLLCSLLLLLLLPFLLLLLLFVFLLSGNWTTHEQLKEWVLDRIKLLQPSRVHLCDGSEQENSDLIRQMVQCGTLIPLNPALRPNSYLARSTASDVARVEEKTFICSENQSDAGPTNNWRDPEEMQMFMSKLFSGAMRGRTM